MVDGSVNFLKVLCLFEHKDKIDKDKVISPGENTINILNFFVTTEFRYCIIGFSILLTCLNGDAGHYIPQLAVAILDYNSHSTGFKFNLKGVAVRFRLFYVINCCLYILFILSLNFVCPFS